MRNRNRLREAPEVQTARHDLDSGTPEVDQSEEALPLPVVKTSRRGPGYVTALSTHLVSLGIALYFLIKAGQGQWFFGDEWDFIVDRGLHHPARGLLVPHNQHWSTIPILIYRALFSTYGLHSYWPYLAVLFALHLLLAHLLWRIMVRAGSDPWVATFLAFVFAAYGAGADNLVWAFQMGFVGAVLFGWAYVTMVDRHAKGDLWLLGAWVVGICALMFSGIAPFLILAGGLSVFFRRGVRAAFVAVLPPAVVFGLWEAFYGSKALQGAGNTHHSLYKLPVYVFTAITNTFSASVGLASAGTVLAAALAWWVISRSRLARGPAAPAFAAAASCVVLFCAIALGRDGLGVAQATSSRYVYVAGAFLFPSIALALSELGRRRPGAVVAIGVLVGLVAIENVSLLHTAAKAQRAVSASQEGEILAAAQIAKRGPVIYGAPDGTYDPNLTVAALDSLRAHDKLPRGFHLSASDYLDAATALQTTVNATRQLPTKSSGVLFVQAGQAQVAREGPTCITFSPSGPDPVLWVGIESPTSLELRSGPSGPISITLRSGATTGATTTFPYSLRPAWINLAATGDLAGISLPPGATSVICSLHLP